MPFFAAVTQAPHYSFGNGGETATARQFYARPTQYTPNGPRIAAAVAGMLPGELRTVWASANDRVFEVQRSDLGTWFDVLDWTPHGVWHAATRQAIWGGRRRNLKFTVYADDVGEYDEIAMSPALGRSVMGTVHYYGNIAQSDTGRVFVGDTFNRPFELDPATDQFSPLPLPPALNGSNGASFSWCTSVGRLAAYGGDSQTWRTITPGVDAAWTTHATGIGNGQHAIVREHPMHARHLVLGGSGTLRRATLVTHGGVATVVNDCPGDVHMANGAESWVRDHPSGCWIVRAFAGTEHRLYAAWPNAGLTALSWQDLGTAPDNALTHPTLIPGYSSDIDLIVSTTGLHAWRLPALLPPGVAPGFIFLVTAGLLPGSAGTAGDAAAPGIVLPATAQLLAGAATAQRSGAADGAALSATAALLAGAAAGQSNAAAPGATLTASVSLLPGAAAGQSAGAAPGVTLSATAALLPGAAQAGLAGTASGVVLVAQAQLQPGLAITPDAAAPGVLLLATAALLPGTATGPASGVAPGVTLQATVQASWGAAYSAPTTPAWLYITTPLAQAPVLLRELPPPQVLTTLLP